MSTHQFDTEVAEQVGVNAAVIFQHIVFWCEKNAANGSNLRDGRYWTYNSMAAFQELFPYLTFSQIRTALAKLEEADLILSGEFNEDRWLRRKWYCVKSQVHLSKIANASAIGRNSYKETDNRTQIENTDNAPIDPDGEPSLFSAIEEPESQADRSESAKKKKEDRFEELWQSYPKAGRKDKQDARKRYVRIVNSGVGPDELIAAALAYSKWLDSGGPRDFRPNPKNLSTWLNKKSWEDEIPEPAPPPSQAPATRWYEDQIER